jgi:hypothetical protein
VKNFCFVHVPKCGGTTLRSIALTRMRPEEILPAQNNTELMRLSREDIRRYPAAIGHFDHGIFDVLPAGTLRFTILRDPVQRYLSTVSHIMRDPHFSHLHERVRDLTFDEALLHPDIVSETRNSVVKLFCHDTIQVGIGTDEEALAQQQKRSFDVYTEVEVAKARLDSYDVVGLMEQYIDSVQLMLLAAGLPPVKIAPVLNEDRTAKQSSASPEAIARVRETLDYEQMLYEYARDRMRQDISSTLYSLALRDQASRDPQPPDRFKFDLAELPGAYGWYEPETDATGTRLWGGSRDEQGFVLKVRHNCKYMVAARFDKREPDKKVRVECSIKGAQPLFTPEGVVVQFETGPFDQVVDLALVYPDAQRPAESSAGSDQRKLGLALYQLGIFRVDSFDEWQAHELLDIVQEAGPGEIDAARPGNSARRGLR